MTTKKPIVITGTDGPVGATLAKQLKTCGQAVRAVGHQSQPAQETLAGAYRQADLRNQADARQVVQGAAAIVHAQPLVRLDGPDTLRLEVASLGTYQLLQAARSEGLQRMVLLSSLSMFEAYDEKYIIDEMWKPRPHTTAHGLAPYYAELVAREFAREGAAEFFCLRIGSLGKAHSLTAEDLVQATSAALAAEFKPLGYRWRVVHISRSDRFNVRNARLELNWQPARENA